MQEIPHFIDDATCRAGRASELAGKTRERSRPPVRCISLTAPLAHAGASTRTADAPNALPRAGALGHNQRRTACREGIRLLYQYHGHRQDKAPVWPERSHSIPCPPGCSSARIGSKQRIVGVHSLPALARALVHTPKSLNESRHAPPRHSTALCRSPASLLPIHTPRAGATHAITGGPVDSGPRAGSTFAPLSRT